MFGELLEDVAGAAMAVTGTKKVVKDLEEGDVVGAAVGAGVAALGLGLLFDDDE